MTDQSKFIVLEDTCILAVQVIKMKNYNISPLKIILLAIIISFMFSSCGEKDGESEDEKKEAEKAPNQLIKLEESTDKIIELLGGPVSNEKEGEMVKESGGNNDKSNEEKEKEESVQDKESQEEGEEDIWSEIDSLITELNYQWNDYAPVAAEDGADQKLIDEYSSSLNNLTDISKSKNQTEALIASSNLYGLLLDFNDLYTSDDESPSELKKINHFVRNAIISATTDNWEQVQQDVNDLNTLWAIFKNDIPEDKQELQGKLDYAISEFEKVANERNKELTEIKGNIVMSSIIDVTKAMESEENGSQKK